MHQTQAEHIILELVPTQYIWELVPAQLPFAPSEDMPWRQAVTPEESVCMTWSMTEAGGWVQVIIEYNQSSKTFWKPMTRFQSVNLIQIVLIVTTGHLQTQMAPPPLLLLQPPLQSRNPPAHLQPVLARDGGDVWMMVQHQLDQSPPLLL